MIKEAEENAEADKRRREEAELRNESEQAIYSVRKAISDLGAEVTDDEKKDIEAKVGALEEALKGGDLDRIRSLKDDLLKASQNIAVKAYQKPRPSKIKAINPIPKRKMMSLMPKSLTSNTRFLRKSEIWPKEIIMKY